ncbi:hypothetical protein [Aeromicrobium sp. UC242_57]|uniref:hypothetical protein n=1 Tax=Aeromicrobium sp. UC242_57 TaxID=3374624 RepID=UPI0037A1E4FC
MPSWSPPQAPSLQAAEIKTFVIDRAPAYLHPRRLAASTDLPLAGTNKIDRRRLHELAAQLESTNGWMS